MSVSPEAAIERALTRERLARQRVAGLAALAAIGVLLATLTVAKLFGVLLAGFAIAAGLIEISVIASARGSAGRAADEVIEAGIMIRPGSHAHDLVDNRLGDLRADRSRRRLATALRGALTDAGRPRSSNPLILAERSIVLRRGTALALLAERDLVLRIARELSDRPADPQAILALRRLLYPQAAGPLAIDDQQREALRQLHRIANILDLNDDKVAPGHTSPS